LIREETHKIAIAMTQNSKFLHAGDPIRAAAWLYYGAEKTQSEVAAALGISRQTVSAYLRAARRKGYVSIRLAPDILERNSCAKHLQARFGLQGVHVVPHAEDAFALRNNVGRAAAGVLCELITADRVVAVSSGRTVSALARYLRPTPNASANVVVVQVSGSSIDAAAHSPEICASTIAAALGARCLNLHAPAFMSSTALAESLRGEPALRQHFRTIAGAHILVFGIGELSRDTMFEQPPYIDRAMRARYIDAGAVGIAFDRFLADNGTEVAGALAPRTMAIDLDTAARIPIRLALCCGVEKRHAVRAALAARLITHVVLDTALAHCILGDEGKCHDR